MIDNMLESIEKNYSEKKLKSILMAINSIENLSEKSRFLSKLGRIVLKHNFLEGINYLQYSLRINPSNYDVINIITSAIEPIRNQEVEKFIEFMRKEKCDNTQTHAGGYDSFSAKDKSFDYESSFKNQNNFNELNIDLGKGYSEKNILELDNRNSFADNPFHYSQVSEKDEILDRSIKKTNTYENALNLDISDENQIKSSRNEEELKDNSHDNVLKNFGEACESLEIDEAAQPKFNLTFSTKSLDISHEKLFSSSKLQQTDGVAYCRNTSVTKHVRFNKFALFKDFVVNAELPLQVLEYADEFADSLFGVIHFLHFLCSTEKIAETQKRKAMSYLYNKLNTSPDDFKAYLRFVEIFGEQE